MFCPNCGHEIDNNAKFCKFCGIQVNVTDQNNNKFANLETEETNNEVGDIKNPKKHKWPIAVTIIFLAIIITVGAILFFTNKNEDEFGKNINANDLALEYTVYTGSRIWVEITPLVDIQDLKVEIFYFQNSNILRQDHEWLEVDFLEKGNTYNLSYDLSNSYPFDRVRLFSISGKKKNNSEDFTECKRTGIIKAPAESLNSNLFTLRLDTTEANSSRYGILYVTSSLDLWDVNFQISEFFTNKAPVTYIPDYIDEMPANQEIAVELKKMISDTGVIEHVSLRSISGRTTEDIIIDE